MGIERINERGRTVWKNGIAQKHFTLGFCNNSCRARHFRRRSLPPLERIPAVSVFRTTGWTSTRWRCGGGSRWRGFYAGAAAKPISGTYSPASPYFVVNPPSGRTVRAASGASSFAKTALRRCRYRGRRRSSATASAFFARSHDPKADFLLGAFLASASLCQPIVSYLSRYTSSIPIFRFNSLSRSRVISLIRSSHRKWNEMWLSSLNLE